MRDTLLPTCRDALRVAGGRLKPAIIDQGMWLRLEELSEITRRQLIVAATGLLAEGCRTTATTPQPNIRFTRIPKADASGSDKNDIIEGTVTGSREGQQIVLYAKNRSWW